MTRLIRVTPAAHEHGWLSTGSETNLDAVDAAELAEMLQFLSQWLASEPARLGASLGEVRRPPAYGLPQLRQLGPLFLPECVELATFRNGLLAIQFYINRVHQAQ